MAIGMDGANLIEVIVHTVAAIDAHPATLSRPH